jgi:hypothetical protein
VQPPSYATVFSPVIVFTFNKMRREPIDGRWRQQVSDRFDAGSCGGLTGI